MADELTPASALALAAVEAREGGPAISAFTFRDCDEYALLAWVDHALRRGRSAPQREPLLLPLQPLFFMSSTF